MFPSLICPLSLIFTHWACRVYWETRQIINTAAVSFLCFTKFFDCTQPLMTPSSCSTSPEDFFFLFSTWKDELQYDNRWTDGDGLWREGREVTCKCPGGSVNSLRPSGACGFSHFRTQIIAPLWGFRSTGLHSRVTEKTKAGRHDINLMEQDRNWRPGGGPSFPFSL